MGEQCCAQDILRQQRQKQGLEQRHRLSLLHDLLLRCLRGTFESIQFGTHIALRTPAPIATPTQHLITTQHLIKKHYACLGEDMFRLYLRMLVDDSTEALSVSQVLLNVVVAVLLDEFISACMEQQEEMVKEQWKEQNKNRLRGVLDPMIRTLINFEDDEDLEARLDHLYHRLDVEGNGLTFVKFRLGLKRDFDIHLSRDDWDIATEEGRLTDDTGNLDRHVFHVMIRNELWKYMRRELSNTLNMGGSAEFRIHMIQQKLLDSKLTQALKEAAAERTQLTNALKDAQADRGTITHDLKHSLEEAAAERMRLTEALKDAQADRGAMNTGLKDVQDSMGFLRQDLLELVSQSQALPRAAFPPPQLRPEAKGDTGGEGALARIENLIKTHGERNIQMGERNLEMLVSLQIRVGDLERRLSAHNHNVFADRHASGRRSASPGPASPYAPKLMSVSGRADQLRETAGAVRAQTNNEESPLEKDSLVLEGDEALAGMADADTAGRKDGQDPMVAVANTWQMRAEPRHTFGGKEDQISQNGEHKRTHTQQTEHGQLDEHMQRHGKSGCIKAEARWRLSSASSAVKEALGGILMQDQETGALAPAKAPGLATESASSWAHAAFSGDARGGSRQEGSASGWVREAASDGAIVYGTCIVRSQFGMLSNLLDVGQLPQIVVLFSFIVLPTRD